MPEPMPAAARAQPRVPPKQALGVKIAVGIVSGSLALIALAIWAIVRAVVQ